MGRFTKSFSDEEEIAILTLFTTNPDPDANVFGLWPGVLSEEQKATLGSAYSRMHEPLKQRLLRAIEVGDIDIGDVNEAISVFSRLRKGSIGKSATKFIQKYAQKFGHNSVKESGVVSYCVENLPGITCNVMTGHPLAHPQVKSTRYMSWTDVFPIMERNKDIQDSSHKDVYLNTLRFIVDSYNKVRELLAEHITKDPTSQEFLEYMLSHTENQNEKDELKQLFKEAAERTGFDYARYLIPFAMPTSQIITIDTRAQEEVLTALISSPLIEDRLAGQKVWDETRKLEPVLLGERCHACRNSYLIKTRETLDALVIDIFPFEKQRDYEVPARTYEIPDSVKMFTDLQLAAAVAFARGHGSFTQYYKFLEQNPQHIKTIIDAAFSERGQHDQPLKEFGHGGLMHESTFDKGAQKDKRRHRRGVWTEQLHTADLGYETPKVIAESDALPIYEEAMEEAAKAFKVVREEDKYKAQLLVPFGYRSRSLYSWHPQQHTYYVELRSKASGHISYREDARDLYEITKKRMPIFASHIIVDERDYPPGFVNLSETKLKRGGETVARFNSRDWFDKNKRE